MCARVGRKTVFSLFDTQQTDEFSFSPNSLQMSKSSSLFFVFFKNFFCARVLRTEKKTQKVVLSFFFFFFFVFLCVVAQNLAATPYLVRRRAIDFVQK
jgi:hypothetical protein|tara:strand:+ start:1041 stop:1334 length:294 start_codon:yes stop_codon:yes gene_type:complete